MTCDLTTVETLLGAAEDSDEFERCVAHVDHCPDCQLKLESLIQTDPVSWEVTQALSAAQPEDLNFDTALTSKWIHNHAGAQSADSLPTEYDDDNFLLPAAHPELMGKLGRYDVECEIGRGGMGVVFRAYDSELHRVVALKVLSRHLTTTAAARRRFAREARAAAAVLHPNVLPIHDVEANGPTPYLVMQYVAGCSLQTRVDRDGTLEPADAMRLAKQTSEALAAAHQQGLIHRDVKPANILLEHGTDRVVLGDFGLARTADDASLTRTGIVAGTPHYMSPEQAGGESVSAQSDLFALGSVMYFMLSGRPPFKGESALGVLNCLCTKKHIPLRAVNVSVPKELSDLVDRLLSKKPSNRPASAEAVAERLEMLMSRMQQGRLRIGPAGNSRVRLVLATVLVFSLLAAALYFAWPALWRQKPGAVQANSTVEAVEGPQSVPPATPRTAPGEMFAEPEPTISPTAFLSSSDWNSWERDLAATEQSLALEEQRYSGIPNRGWILLTPDVWSEQLQEIEAEINRLQAEDVQAAQVLRILSP